MHFLPRWYLLIYRFRLFSDIPVVFFNSRTCPKKCPKHVQKCSKNIQTHVPNISENVRKMSENMSQTCPKMSEICPKTCPKHLRKCPKNVRKRVPNIPRNIQKSLKNMITNHSRSHPESNPVPSLPSLPPLSVSQPIGLIPSQDKGSPELSYVSELETKTHRNNLVAEKVTWAFLKLKKALF